MFSPVGRPRTRKVKEPETVLQAIFIKRVKQELEDRQLTPRQFAMLVGAPKERTIYDVLNRGAVPGLTVVHQCAVALNLKATDLLVERAAKESATNVRKLPVSYPSWSEKIGKQGKLRRKMG